MIHRIVKHTKKPEIAGGAHRTGRTITSLVTPPVTLRDMRTPVRRTLIVSIELLVGVIVLGAMVLGAFYYRLEKGAIDLDFVVPSLERAINEQLSGLSVKISSAFVGKNTHSPGVHFRLRNIVLYNREGEAIANAPLAAVDLNGRALMWGRIAPSQVVFIRPTLEISYSETNGLSFSYPRVGKSGDFIGELLKEAGDSQKENKGRPVVSSSSGKIQIMKAVAAAFEEARAHRNTTSYLTQFGVRDATVNFFSGEKKYSWKMPDFIIDLKHGRKGSLIRGFGKLGIGENGENIPPWKIRFQTKQSEKTKGLMLDLGFGEISPESLHHLLPEIEKLRLFGIPFGGKVNAKLNSVGELQSAFANIRLAAGRILIPWLDINEDGIEDFRLDSGDLKLAYSRKGNELHILPSPFRWGKNRTLLSGVIGADNPGNKTTRFKFAFKGSETRLAADDFQLGPMIVDEWWMTGIYSPDQDEVNIADFYLRAGNTVFRMKGRIETVSTNPGLFVKGHISGASIPVLKRLWPGMLATGARKWVGENIQDGKLVTGNFKIALPSNVLAKLPGGADPGPEMIDARFVLQDLVVQILPGNLPVSVPDAKVRISGRQLTVDIPRGRIDTDDGHLVRLSHGNYSISDLRQKHPDSDLSFRIAGTVRDIAGLVDRMAPRSGPHKGLVASGIDGKVKGVVTMHIPLVKDVQFSDIVPGGDLRIGDLKSKNIFGDFSVEGGTVNVKLSRKAVDIEGGIVVHGLPVRLNAQHILGASRQRQPPVRLTAILGKSERKQLGLGFVNETVKGDIPVVVTFSQGKKDTENVTVRADLTDAKVDFTAAGWSKVPGIPAVLQFDVGKRRSGKLSFHNLDFVSDQMVVEGGLVLDGKTGRLDRFSFSRVSFEGIEKMSLNGKRGSDGLVKLVADIDTVRGLQLLRSRLLKKSGKKTSSVKASTGPDFDLHARIRKVTGGKGTYVSGGQLDLYKRNGRINRLDFKGLLNGQSSIAVRLESATNGKRILKAESRDAGATFRMVGLYPNIQGGLLSLVVDMDPRGTSEKSGTLWVKDFDVIGARKLERKPGSSDIFKNDLIGSRQKGKSRSRRARIMRTRFRFDQLKAPFSYGDGQFILHDSYVNGPIIGATLRGKIDFRTERMKLGGTYVPLYGLNSAIGEIPVLNELLVGRQGEGVFGVTFAIEGPTAKPTVIVNPVSLLTPGVFRQIFDFNNSVRNRQFQKLPKSKRRYRKHRQTGAYP